MKSKILWTLIVATLTISHSYEGICSERNSSKRKIFDTSSESASESEIDDSSSKKTTKKPRKTHNKSHATENMGHVTELEAIIAQIPVTQKNAIKEAVERFNSAHPSQIHTKFGVGLRFPYPSSPARDSLKRGEKQSPYTPVNFVAPVVIDSVWAPGKSPQNAWADPEDISKIAQQIKDGRKRVIPFGESATGLPYRVVDGKPINPLGKTGISGRGELGLWGANPAADPVIFKINNHKLYVLLIKRNDGGNVISSEWAIPGGMLDTEDHRLSANAALRELKEETGVNLKNEKNSFFIGKVYAGYSNDERNTDNAWMETNVYSWLVKDQARTTFKIDQAEVTQAAWIEVTSDFLTDGHFFAGHGHYIRLAVLKLLSAR